MARPHRVAREPRAAVPQAAARDGPGLHVTLVLIAALSDPPGLGLTARDRHPARGGLVSARWTRSEGVPVPPAPARVALDFATPLRIGPKHALGTAFGNVVVGPADRGAQIARWSGLAPTPAAATGATWQSRCGLTQQGCDRSSGTSSLRPAAMTAPQEPLDVW